MECFQDDVISLLFTGSRVAVNGVNSNIIFEKCRCFRKEYERSKKMLIKQFQNKKQFQGGFVK